MSGLRPLVCIAALVLAGYWTLFLGADFFVEEDPVTLFAYAEGNAAGNGWRPDKALGTSFFFADPGMFHAWAPWALFSRALGSGRTFYTVSIVVLLVAAACAQYLLLRRIAPRIGAAAWLLSPLVVFGPVQHELLFQRHWIALSIAAPLVILLLDEYLQRPRQLHFAYATLLFWGAWFFGSAAAFSQTLIVGVLFAAVRAWLGVDRWRLVRRVAALYAAALTGTVVLGAWVFYPMIVEVQIVDYVRAPRYVTKLALVNVAELAKIVTRWLHSGLLDNHMPGAILTGVFEWTTSWTNVTAVFPCLLLLALARRSADAWLVTLKWMLLALMANELLYASPLYSHAIQIVWPLYPLHKFQPVYYCLQVGMIACLLSDLASPDRRFADAGDAVRSRRATAGILAVVYASLAVFAAVSLLASDATGAAVIAAFDRFGPAHAAGFSKAVLREAVAFDFGQLVRSMRWPALLFYALIAAIMVAWSRRPTLLSVTRGSVTAFAALLLMAGILMSWAIYPLNRQPLVWDGAAGAILAPTDRLYAFFDPRYQAIEKTPEAYRREWSDGEFGLATYRVGYINAPALNLSGTMSFWPADQAAYIDRAFREGGSPLVAMRHLTFGPFVASPWLDMAAVSHFVTWRPLPDSLGYPLVYKAPRLYVYRNPTAWPYFYLAHDIRPAESLAEIPTPRRGTAYLSARDVRPVGAAFGESRITLASFSPGRLVFEFDGRRDEFLAIADGWHPFWRARADGAALDVVKANGVFKGAWIPEGRHRVEFYFDTSPFMPGVYASGAAWLGFAAWIAWAARRARIDGADRMVVV
jgi:hypothetical protein